MTSTLRDPVGFNSPLSCVWSSGSILSRQLIDWSAALGIGGHSLLLAALSPLASGVPGWFGCFCLIGSSSANMASSFLQPVHVGLLQACFLTFSLSTFGDHSCSRFKCCHLLMTSKSHLQPQIPHQIPDWHFQVPTAHLHLHVLSVRKQKTMHADYELEVQTMVRRPLVRRKDKKLSLVFQPAASTGLEAMADFRILPPTPLWNS